MLSTAVGYFGSTIELHPAPSMLYAMTDAQRRLVVIGGIVIPPITADNLLWRVAGWT
jgi:hypothetical protein